jgi:hypothetical protein
MREYSWRQLNCLLRAAAAQHTAGAAAAMMPAGALAEAHNFLEELAWQVRAQHECGGCTKPSHATRLARRLPR